MNGRPPRLSPPRLLAGLVLPWVAYLIIRRLTGSSVGALAITDAVPSTWLLGARIAVLGTGLVITAHYLRNQKKRRHEGPHPAHAERDL